MTSRPVLRAGKFGDIPDIYAILAAGHAASRYVDLPLNEKAAKALFMNALQRAPAQTTVIVAEGENGIEGFIIGIVQPLYHVFDAKEATDLFLLAKPGAHGATAARLLKAMHKWAKSVPGVAVIRQGNTDAVTPAERSSRLMERAGMRCTGFIYEKNT